MHEFVKGAGQQQLKGLIPISKFFATFGLNLNDLRIKRFVEGRLGYGKWWENILTDDSRLDHARINCKVYFCNATLCAAGKNKIQLAKLKF